MTTTKTSTSRCTIPVTSNPATAPAKPATPAPAAPVSTGWKPSGAASPASSGFSSASSFTSAPRPQGNPLLAPLPPPSGAVTLTPPPPVSAASAPATSRAQVSPPIDRTRLGTTDRMLVDAMMLDGMVPGSSKTVTVNASGDLAAVLGVQVGAEVTVEVSRDDEEPSKFGFKLGGAGDVSAVLGADTAGEEAHGTAGVLAEGGVGIEVDLAKPGEATALAGFAAHTGLAVFPRASTALALVEQLPGVSIPGEPLPFLRDHLSEVEVAVGGKLTGEAAVALFGAASAELEAAMKGGAKLERDGDNWKISANVASSAEATLSGGAGAGGAAAEVTLGSGSAGVTFSRELLVKPGVPPTLLEDSYQAELELAAAANVTGSTALGGKATVSVALEKLPPAFAESVKLKLAAGDVEGASAVLQQALASGEVKGELAVSGTAETAGEAKLNLKAGGTGGQGAIGGGYSTEVPLGSVECTLSRSGVELDGSLLGMKGEVLWDQLRRQLAER